ncbi:hypothetical protein FG91_03721 [Sphingopyxis sp. LC81]|uniref:hypothetical protein n=1 Tax=Sphingopyxis sp. LC81 TaxID=1502850 RepID=UPI00050DBCD3|nr:hypothetical protein [Sphingopyxis sp. LC81]KGB52190.1 hypothetical protein FG91_03721 [Sphingopyxis sp. LC81]
METVPVVITVTMIIAFFLFPKRPTPKPLIIAGCLLSVAGWGGIFLGLALGDTTLMQSELVASLWMGVFGTFAGLLAPVALVTGIFALLRNRKTKRTP